jgi:hypothetical protein
MEINDEEDWTNIYSSAFKLTQDTKIKSFTDRILASKRNPKTWK